MSKPFKLKGGRLSVTFYFINEDAEVTPVEVRFDEISPEGLSELNLLKVQGQLVKRFGEPVRPCTQGEIDKYMMVKEFSEGLEQGILVFPGPKEQQ